MRENEQTLHLPNHQLFIQSIRPSQKEQLATPRIEKLAAQTNKPILPEGLCCGKISAPDPGTSGVGWLALLVYQRWD